MSTNSRTDHFFIYPQDKNGKHLGVTICVVLRDGRMYHGEALCSENDQFNKKVGRELSFERAIFEYNKDSQYKDLLEPDSCPGCESDYDDITDNLITESELISKVRTKKETWALIYEDFDKSLYQVEYYKAQLLKGSPSTVIEVSAHPADASWSAHVRNKPMFSIIDDGDGVDLNIDGSSQYLSYSNFQDIANIYKLWKKNLNQTSKFKRLK